VCGRKEWERAARPAKKRGKMLHLRAKRIMSGTFLFNYPSFFTIMNRIRERGNYPGYLETIKLRHKNEPIGLLLNSRRNGNV
jgi:hypothetical protein